METVDKIITLGLVIAVICLISLNHTAELDLTQLNNTCNKDIAKGIRLSDYYLNVTKSQTNTIEELKKENQLLILYFKYQEGNITNLSTQLKNSEIKTAQYKFLADKLTKEKLIHTTNYNEVIQFARADTTKYNAWTTEYDCKSFTEDFIKNSIKQGLYACFARVHFTNNDWHAVVQYNTNRGKIYIEPQTGQVINLREGMSLYGYTVDYWTDCIGGENHG